MRLRRLGFLGLWLAAAATAAAQDTGASLDDLLQSAQQWAEENLDTNVWAALSKVDQDRAQRFLRDLQQRFQGSYVIDLAALKGGARTLLPLLEAQDETRPYASWLRAQLDYLEVADEFRLTIPPPPTEPGQPPKPAPNPDAASERQAWTKQLARRPPPQGADALVPRLKPIFTAERVPPQLIWLAEVESSFDPAARSPAGAVGLYQLMPATARRFGLVLRPADQRLQPDDSARAAAGYLRTLHDHFHDWRLSLAAYNAGEGAVQKLTDRYGTQSFEAIAPHLPAETQMYVPRVEATLLRREGVTLAKLAEPPG